jgi:N-acyl-D-amino-acid deacylase
MKLFDLLIKGGTVADGSGGNPYTADVGILQDKIAFIGNADGAKAAKVIDAGGLIVSPGFIEMHSHDDLDMISNPTVPYKLLQGITTEVIGLCGIGCAPYDPEKAREWENWAGRFLCDTPAPWTWRSFGGFLDRLEKAKASLNVVGLVSHGAIRASVMGLEDRNPAPEELAAMKRLLADSMEQGARGLSTGLIYVPMVYSGPEEMIQLCRVVAEKEAWSSRTCAIWRGPWRTPFGNLSASQNRQTPRSTFPISASSEGRTGRRWTRRSAS